MECPRGVTGLAPSVHPPASLPRLLSYLFSSSESVVPTVDAFAGGASITGPSPFHEALTPFQYLAAAPRSILEAKNTDERRAIGSQTVTSSTPLRDKVIVRDTTLPQGGTATRGRIAHHGVAFLASGDCLPRKLQGMASSREKVRLRVHYEPARDRTVHHH